MAALAFDQGEGKHPAGGALAPTGHPQGFRRPLWPPLEAAASRSRPLPRRGRLPRPRPRGPGPLPAAPPPWAGPGRLPRPAGGARPGAAPGSWPRSPRPFPAPFPLSSTPGVGDPEAPRASGQKPGDTVADFAPAASVSAVAFDPLSSLPVRGPTRGALAEPCWGVPRASPPLPSPVAASLGPGPDASRAPPA